MGKTALQLHAIGLQKELIIVGDESELNSVGCRGLGQNNSRFHKGGEGVWAGWEKIRS